MVLDLLRSKSFKMYKKVKARLLRWAIFKNANVFGHINSWWVE